MKKYLLCYDIFDEKRLYQVRKLVYPLALGGQRSVLEIYLTKKEVKKLLKDLSKIISKEDKINLIEVADDVIFVGKKINLKYEDGVIII